ncbi:non-heme iron oxygenase ferredoxin subunit [Paraburkholderia aromaticivorans]|uniref:non-heme iron oxygenase ferredoxin subunit n=1 Tax=Paraburkholderia aromaticivorans TaxID=2026199 RepID=UPI001456006D|nr:non-heme iron oxygenase ferredoxin subunit [Paraburkholderia aromaticivorans]
MNADETFSWQDVIAVDDVPADDVVGVIVAGKDLAIYSVDGDIFASDNLCTHGHARLCDGFLDGHEIECPLHQGKFDVRSGESTCAPVTLAIRIYPVRIENGRVYVAFE